MKMPTISIANVLLVALALGAPGFAVAQTQSETASACQAQHAAAATHTAPAAPELQAALRSLWLGHVEATRAYAVAVRSDDPAAADKATKDVVANAQQLADAVAGFYGDAAGKRMFELLAGHWGGVKALTDAVHADEPSGTEKAMRDLNANAREIAVFLSGANPYLPEKDVHGLMAAHVAHHDAQIHEIMDDDMTAEAETWKAMKNHMDVIADAMAGAIAKQFPDKAS